MKVSLSEKLQESLNYIENKLGKKPRPKVGLILGSGLGYLADYFEDRVAISYEEIPHFLSSTAIGHAGQLVFGKFQGVEAVVMQGRFHAYEGYPLSETVFPIYLMNYMGVEGVVLTNAAGGINLNNKAGSLIVIKDIINMAFRNPLIGPNDEEVGPRFPDMSSVLDEEWFNKVSKRVEEKNKELKTGVYLFCLGPNYETPAEIRAFRTLGADMVGMSTVPEIIAARHCGMKIFGVSCITNMAAGVLPQKLTHQEVMETANRVKQKFESLVRIIVEEL
ncbi:MAG TPA: purine-nucleoside phosphorylase [Thermotogota bacterium]|nr:purine-nucleoside phosphorylase [Thermotogota bacterium]HPJ89146.1 purine-nucleoside phosphorylase [Thermotogota bacterium]HPR97388.1 purine-nucleoside phosphorylase [Thermotogota bacterium]